MRKATIYILVVGMGFLIADSVSAFVAFKSRPTKSVASCANVKNVIKVTDSFSFCAEENTAMTLVSTITFINCSGTIYKSSSCSSLSSPLGPASETHFKVHAGGGHMGYDMFIAGPQAVHYLEMDNDADPSAEADKKAMFEFKKKNVRDARTCLRNMLSTTGTKCTFNAAGVSQ